MKEFVISEAKVETAVLVGLITQTPCRDGWGGSSETIYAEVADSSFSDLCRKRKVGRN